MLRGNGVLKTTQRIVLPCLWKKTQTFKEEEDSTTLWNNTVSSLTGSSNTKVSHVGTTQKQTCSVMVVHGPTLTKPVNFKIVSIAT